MHFFVYRMYRIGMENDRISQNYIVTHQREIGIYYDASNADLQAQKIAMRIKEFHSLKEGEATKVTKILFAKRTLETNDLFTNRVEYEVALPENASQTQIRNAMKALLAELDIDSHFAEKLEVSEVIDNERYGFDLFWRNTVKIGFITVDSFRSQNADTDSGGSTPPFRQWEIEVLPEYKSLTEMYPQVFSDFFRGLENDFNGKLNITPKAHQHLRLK